MSKPTRYLLLFATLLTAVCLGSTAAALAWLERGAAYSPGWSRSLPLGRDFGVYIQVYRNTEFGYVKTTGLHHINLPVSATGLILTTLGTCALAALVLAGFLTRPLFGGTEQSVARVATENITG